MVSTFQKFIQRAQVHLINLGRHRTRTVLLGYNDRLLSDAGFSRRLLEQGVDAWPWREESVETTDTAWATAAKDESTVIACELNKTTRESVAQIGAAKQPADLKSSSELEIKAIKELNAYSDEELMDIGVQRGAIPELVRNGRPGIDDANHDGTRNAA